MSTCACLGVLKTSSTKLSTRSAINLKFAESLSDLTDTIVALDNA